MMASNSEDSNPESPPSIKGTIHKEATEDEAQVSPAEEILGPEDEPTEQIEPETSDTPDADLPTQEFIWASVEKSPESNEIHSVEPPESEAPASEQPTSEPPASETAANVPFKRLHPASLFINLLPQTFRTLRGSWLLLVFLFFTNNSSGTEIVDLMIIFALFFASIYRTFIHYMTLRYRLIDDVLEVNVGLLYKQNRRLDVARIQNIELKQNPLHKFFSLTELRIETAGSAEEGLLSALSIEEAEFLRSRLRPSLRKEETPTPELSLVKNSIVELLIYGITKRTVGVVVVLTAIASEVISLMHPKDAQELASALSPKIIAGLFLIAFAGSWLWSALNAILNHNGYQLSLQEDSLQSEEGLVTKRRIEIPQRKVQLVMMVEPLLRRTIGYGTMFIETAAFGVADGRIRKTEGLIPMLESHRFSTLLRAAAPQIDIDPWKVKLLSPHRKALYRSIAQGLLRFSILVGLLMFVLRTTDYHLYLLLLIPLSIPISYLDWKWQGWLITDNSIIARRGYLNRRTWILDRDKIQNAYIFQSPFMRYHNLAHIVVHVAGTEIVLPDISKEDAFRGLEDIMRQWNPQTLEKTEQIGGYLI
ncbi:MAG: PH domain-containing protein [Myxococcota bacterium]|nr:PH domain-containing protein [Myxococcota bacterium]